MKRAAPFLAILALACAPWGSIAAPIQAEPEYQPYPAVHATPKERRVEASQVRGVTLEAPDPASVRKAAAPASIGAPQQVGFARDVPGIADGISNVASLRWATLAGGARVAAFSITSPEAAALRVALRVKAIPAGTLIRFYAPDAGPVYEVSAEEIQETIGRNLHSGNLSEKALRYWSPVIEGATAVVEIELPPGSAPSHLDLAAPQVSHLVASPANGFASSLTKAAQRAASCNNDVVCYAGTWSTESNAVARMTFVDGGASYFCTGTLLADLDTTTTAPYFLSANHCIDNQPAASTLETFWFYRSAACNSSVNASNAADLTGGATLVYNSASTDTALLKLAKAPPGGAMYAGWSVGSVPAVTSKVVTVHHPQGDVQKISFGGINSFNTCQSSGSESFSCRTTSPGVGNFFEVNWTSGITEPGSSGAALFTQTGHYVIGQLYGGGTSCSAPTSGSDFFGRFDIAYTAGLSRFLAPSSSPTAPLTVPAGSGSTGGGTTIVPALNYTALWWNPAESGWGLSITQHDSRLFAAWFVYGADGSPQWVVMPGGTWSSTTSITGDVYSTSGPPSGQPFNASLVSSLKVGTATIDFSAVDRAVLSYAVNGVAGTKAIQRQDFGVVDSTAVSSYGDLWWTASESGWGLSMSQQYRTLFSVLYTYGTSGQAVWYVMPGGTWNGSTYTGLLYATSTPPFNFYASAFNPSNVSTTAVGTMSIQFSDPNTATLTYNINGQTFTKAITRETF
jgi:lysyl endopeptidase